MKSGLILTGVGDKVWSSKRIYYQITMIKKSEVVCPLILLLLNNYSSLCCMLDSVLHIMEFRFRKSQMGANSPPNKKLLNLYNEVCFSEHDTLNNSILQQYTLLSFTLDDLLHIVNSWPMNAVMPLPFVAQDKRSLNAMMPTLLDSMLTKCFKIIVWGWLLSFILDELAVVCITFYAELDYMFLS